MRQRKTKYQRYLRKLKHLSKAIIGAQGIQSKSCALLFVELKLIFSPILLMQKGRGVSPASWSLRRILTQRRRFIHPDHQLAEDFDLSPRQTWSKNRVSLQSGWYF